MLFSIYFQRMTCMLRLFLYDAKQEAVRVHVSARLHDALYEMMQTREKDDSRPTHAPRVDDITADNVRTYTTVVPAIAPPHPDGWKARILATFSNEDGAPPGTQHPPPEGATRRPDAKGMPADDGPVRAKNEAPTIFEATPPAHARPRRRC